MKMGNRRQKSFSLYRKILLWVVAAIFAVAPFYTAITVWAASHLEHFDLFRIWKEIILFLLAMFVVGFVITHRKWAAPLFKSKLMLLTALYIALVLMIGAYDLITKRVDNDAVIYGWLINLRHIGFFSVVLLALTINPLARQRNFPWQRLVLIPAGAVILFGFLQMTILPADILTHIGYGENTTVPYGTIDNKSDLVRIQSTLRGPNPLGAYLLIIITLLAALSFTARTLKRRLYIYGGIALGLVVLVGTYSRSAALGLFISLFVLYAVYNKSFINKHILGIIYGVVGLTVVGLFLLKQNSYFVENFVFHTSKDSTAARSSNDERYQALTRGIDDVVDHPLGSGVGSAGPASLRNGFGSPKIAENYYIQLAQEVGILILALFVAINIMIGRELWRARRNLLALALFASLIGATFVNMLSHAWADDTLAYIWWGLAGVALAPTITSATRQPASRRSQLRR